MTTPDGDEFAPITMAAFRTAQDALRTAMTNIKKEYDALRKRIEDLLARVQKELNNDSIWASISEWWTDKIEKAVKLVHEHMKKIGDLVSQILGSVSQVAESSALILPLFERGLDWAVKVNVPLSEIGPDMTGSGAIDNWYGPAKNTYEKRVLDQIGAVEAATGKVKATANWLASVAEANVEYMAKLAGQAADIIGQIVTVVIDATATASGAVTQIVVTLQDAAELIGSCVAEAIKYVADLATRLAGVLTKITEIASEYGDRTSLPGGKWPSPVNA